MNLDNPIYYEDQNHDIAERHEGNFSLVWRPLVARFFPDTEMIYWVPEYMDTLRSRKKQKEQGNNNDNNNNDAITTENFPTSEQDKVELNFNYDRQCYDQQQAKQVLSPKSRKITMLSPLKRIPQLLSPRSTKALNNSESLLLPESPESQKITITFSPESVTSFKSPENEHRTSDFQSPATASTFYEAPSNFYLLDKNTAEKNPINFLGRRFNLSRQHRVVSDATDDFIFHRPNAAAAKLDTKSPSYINPLELQRINHRHSRDPLPTPPPLSPWEPYGKSGHIYMNDTKILKGRIPEPRVLDGYLTSSIDQTLNRNLDYEPLGMKVISNQCTNSVIQKAKEEADMMYRINLRLYSCIVLLILILGVVLILVILRVPVF